ncbi:MAG: hypothetical protein M1831_006445 [Alyxoria varia]|nr:MAG: hypothetical protein M1831_006445 [Alyxoria varia]
MKAVFYLLSAATLPRFAFSHPTQLGKCASSLPLLVTKANEFTSSSGYKRAHISDPITNILRIYLTDSLKPRDPQPVADVPASEASSPGKVVWTDQNGNPLSHEEAMKALKAGGTTGEGAPRGVAHGNSSSTYHVTPAAALGDYKGAKSQAQSKAAVGGVPAEAPGPQLKSESDSAPSPDLAFTDYAPQEDTHPDTQPSHDVEPDLSTESASSSPPSGKINGLSYSPYNVDHSCKTQHEVNTDISRIASSTTPDHAPNTLRIYGTDCNQVTTVLTAATQHSMRIMAGIFDIERAGQETAQLISAVKAHGNGNDWHRVAAVSVGNEIVNTYGAGKVHAVLAALGEVRSLLRAAGYKGPVVTVDTFVALKAHPELCRASDFAAANAHAFFDSEIEASGAGEWARRTREDVKEACGGKRTVITESGWPSRGSGANGRAKPGTVEQREAVAGLRKAFEHEGDLNLYSAFDHLWKEDGEFGCEKHFGVI